MSANHTVHELPAWLDAARQRHRPDPRGSLGLVDSAAALRGVASVSTGQAFALSRPLQRTEAGVDGVGLDVWSRSEDINISAYDRINLECHGTQVTHLDALNHFGLYDTFYATSSADPADGVDVGRLAQRPVVTRAIFLDIVEQLDAEHATSGNPIGASHLQAALDRAGTEVTRGDALVLYMGRERFEANGGRFAPIAQSPDGRPGIGEDGASWLSRQPIGILAWDFLDAHPHSELRLSVHALSWAVGLVLIDNCSLGEVRAVLAERAQRTALFVASPLPIDGGTGSAINPVVVL